MQRPDYFAAAVPLMAGLETTRAASIRGVPVWVVHASDDAAVPVTESRAIVGALRQEGGHPIHTEFALGGHFAFQNAYLELPLVDWTFSQSRSGGSESVPRLVVETPASGGNGYLVMAEPTVDLGGRANSYGDSIRQVAVTNRLYRTGSFSEVAELYPGAARWSLRGVPLQAAATNAFSVLATAGSGIEELGGTTTFSTELAIRQGAPIRAALIRTADRMVLDWSGGLGPFRVERTREFAPDAWLEIAHDAVPPLILPDHAGHAFYRIEWW